MTDIYISLLKGSTNNKLKLLEVGYSLEGLLELSSSDRLKKEYDLDLTKDLLEYPKIIEQVDKLQIKTISILSTEYPQLLKEIYDPPFILYYRGCPSCLNNPLVSVVGTRKPSLMGYYGAFQLGLDLGKSKVGVVSGLAVGIDGASHLGNILGGGQTVAVLGCGIDMLYPKSNNQIAQKIIACGGVILSEYPPLSGIKPYYFPKRNRIIAGLSGNTVIIQAPKKSGSLITGDLALENGRNVYVHSSGANDTKFLGTNKYIKDGAVVIDRGYPIINDLDLQYDPIAFNKDDYTRSELLALELKGEVVKFRGGFFKL